MVARTARLVAAIPILLLTSCSLFTTTQISFWNSTFSYTFQAIQIGSVDAGTLGPNTTTAYFPIAAGTYTLSTEDSNGVWTQWPTRPQISPGYSYQLVFALDISGNLYYSTYVSMIQ